MRFSNDSLIADRRCFSPSGRTVISHWMSIPSALCLWAHLPWTALIPNSFVWRYMCPEVLLPTILRAVIFQNSCHQTKHRVVVESQLFDFRGIGPSATARVADRRSGRRRDSSATYHTGWKRLDFGAPPAIPLRGSCPTPPPPHLARDSRFRSAEDARSALPAVDRTGPVGSGRSPCKPPARSRAASPPPPFDLSCVLPRSAPCAASPRPEFLFFALGCPRKIETRGQSKAKNMRLGSLPMTTRAATAGRDAIKGTLYATT